MEWVMILIFIAGYLLIALEHPLKINKSGTALLLGTVLWVIYTYHAAGIVPFVSKEEFALYLEANKFLKTLPLSEQITQFVVNHQVLDSVGEICETLLFLVGAMITVELIDTHGGFTFITDRITTHNKRTLLWLITGITFFMSAVLDNLTTSIVMIMLIRKLVGDYKDRWILGSLIIIAANSGGSLVADRRCYYDYAVGKWQSIYLGHHSPPLFAMFGIVRIAGMDSAAEIVWHDYAA